MTISRLKSYLLSVAEPTDNSLINRIKAKYLLIVSAKLLKQNIRLNINQYASQNHKFEISLTTFTQKN